MAKSKGAPKREAKKPRKAAPPKTDERDRGRTGAMSTESQRRYTRAEVREVAPTPSGWRQFEIARRWP